MPQSRCAYEVISEHFDSSRPKLACAGSLWAKEEVTWEDTGKYCEEEEKARAIGGCWV